MDNKTTWAVFPLQSLMMVQEQPVDIYVIVNCDDANILSFVTFLDDLPSEKELKAAFKKARKACKGWPQKLLVQKEDPGEAMFLAIATKNKMGFEVVPTTQLDYLKGPIQESFDQFQGATSAEDTQGQESLEQARRGIPESYDPCSCNSGKKYKFCCKVIAREIMEAMCATEVRQFSEAMKWIDAARDRVGDTAEIACREAIVYGLKSPEEFSAKLSSALDRFPEHPRLHYLQAIEHKSAGKLKEAEQAYLAAVERYPKTDKYRLNEVWNNLGTVYFDLDDFHGAKNAWEKALGYMPIDETCKRNLFEFIYENPDLDEELRTPSPFIKKYL